MSHSTLRGQKTTLALFATAVAAAAATFGICHAIARLAGRRSYFVSYTSPLGGTVHTEACGRTSIALHRFEKAVQADLLYTL